MERLLAELAPSVHRFGLRMCHSTSDADDVLQDTLLAVTQHLGEFEGRASLSSWVFTLARTACARRRRGLKNQPALSTDQVAEPVDHRPSPEDHAERQQLAERIVAALDRLPESYREVLLLRDVEGLTAPEVAAALGVNVDALKSRLHRARGALREALRPLLEADRRPAPVPSCPDVAEMLSRKLEGELGADACAQMEAHLEGCERCTRACDAVKSALSACQSYRQRPVPPSVQERVRRAVRTWIEGRG